MNQDECRVCGGDGQIHNSFGLTNKCPACRGSGRRAEAAEGMRDVTKTKPSHFHRPATPAEIKLKHDAPTTVGGLRLAGEVRACPHCSGATKEQLIREIIEYEGVHGSCTKTFMSKLRKKLRPETEA